MKRFLFMLVWAVISLEATQGAPSPRYINFGTVTNVPQIDAVEFINYGQFTVFSELPYDFQNTRRFTNFGQLSGSVGYKFDTVSDTGRRSPAEVFFNDGSASVTAGAVSIFGGFIAGPLIFGTGLSPDAQLRVTADTIINKGLLSVGSEGIIRLDGDVVDLSRGGLEVQPIGGGFGGGFFCFPGGSPFKTETNYFPDSGVFDQSWYFDSNIVFNIGNNLGLRADGTNTWTITSPPHRAVVPTGGGFFGCYFTNISALFVGDASGFVLTNQMSPTNYLIQAVFVSNLDPNVAKDVRFYPSTVSTNPLMTAVVELKSAETNVISGGHNTNTLYLIDYLASETNYVYLTNLLSSVACPTFMPASYTLSRAQPCEFLLGSPSNAVANPTMFTEILIPVMQTNVDIVVTNIGGTDTTNFTEFTTNILVVARGVTNMVTNSYAAYSALVTNVLFPIAPVPGASISNGAGRVEVDADVMNLERTRIRGEGLISIRTRHLQASSTNAAVDSQNLSFDLASTNGFLRVTNLAKPRLERYSGTVRAWSGIWTNQFEGIVTNTIIDTNAPSGTTNVISTNVVEVGFHAFLLSGRMLTEQGVQVHEFTARSTNLVLSDSMQIVGALNLQSERVTIASTLQLTGLIDSWNVDTAPRLSFLTNNGVISVANNVYFGSDRAVPYARVVNTGRIFGGTISVRSDEVINAGTMDAFLGPILLTNQSTVIDGGQFTAATDIQLTSHDMKLRDFTADALGGSILINVTNNLSDAGKDFPNTLQTVDGVYLFRKPATGDLLGTTIISLAARYAEVTHAWAAEDRGTVITGPVHGFTNNAALGRLLIESDFDTLHTFSGVRGNNALYVDYLEFRGPITNDVTQGLQINPGLVIYFADSNLPIDDTLVPIGRDFYGGRLRWVPFAGPNSAVDVRRKDGTTTPMNRAERESRIIDTDNDGIANGFDNFPLDPDPFQVTLSSVSYSQDSGGIVFTWQAAPQTTYDVEYTTNLVSPQWNVLTQYSNSSNSAQTARVLDLVKPGQPQRYYRIRFTP